MECKICTGCGLNKAHSEYHKRPNRKSGIVSKCKVCVAEIGKDRWSKVGVEICERNRKKYAENEELKEYIKKLARDYHHANREKCVERMLSYKNNNIEKLRLSQKVYYENNKEVRYAGNARRRASELKALPLWVDMEKITDIYKKAAELTKQTGIKYSVDHYYPLKSNKVCGLHVHTNLRIIPLIDNMRKGNKFPEEDI